MELFHVGHKIDKITQEGRFDEFLFFGVNASHDGDTTYKINIDESDIADPNSFFYRDDYKKLDYLVTEIMNLVGCDGDHAEDLLSQRQTHDDAEIDWNIQTLTARAAQTLGFRAVAIPDEYGTSYMIDMWGHESDLIIID